MSLLGNLFGKSVEAVKDTVTLSFIRDETKSLYIARPESAMGQLVYMHPDKSIPRGAKITVRSDECALFFREGKFIARLNPGTELLDTANLPFLGHFLVDHFTGANHFLCELFFVATHECRLDSGVAELGQYKDLNSANVVGINARLSYTVRIKDPVTLMTSLTGLSAWSGAAAQQVLDGRIFNQLRKTVGMRSMRQPVMQIVSNVDVESISQEIARLTDEEFMPLGLTIGRIYDLAMQLDDASLQLLRDFGKQESQNRIASQDGYTEFNLVQGQRAALEGLGKGMESHGVPVMGSFGDLTRRGPSLQSAGVGAGAVRHAAAGTVISGQAAFIVQTDRGPAGPYSARQVALMAISKGQSLAQVQIRSTQDPEDMYFAADLEPQIVQEFKRRSPPGAA
ncbi:SPFH domain-containing protein [Limnohabitans parvus]|jgi:membrane protease subunit (stomatin/prohibitin family)|nr:SPFH domain-containing protein [Limnohabitans parvus]MBP6275983.1 SPFH domain-containing protein [Limnohabitans sp.]